MAEGSGSSSVTTSPVWLRLAAPSIADIFFIALFGTLLLTPLAVRLLGDAGIGWHIRTGQLIIMEHRIPHTDPFSSSVGGKPWYAWEWLYDLVVGECEARLGLNGVVWFNAAVTAAAFSWLLRWLIRRGAHLLVATALALLALCASMIHLLARPHVVTWLFTMAWFVVLEGYERRSEDVKRPIVGRSLLLFPLSMLLWVNVHGGFLMGFVLLGIFLAAALWEWSHWRSDRIEDALQEVAARHRATKLAGVALLSVLASLVNPYGWRLYQHILSYLSSRFLMNHIQEFQSPDFHGIAQRCFLVLLLITLVTLACRGRQLRASAILIVIFAVYTGLYASRSIPVSALLLVMVIGPLIPGWSRAGFLSRAHSLQTQLTGHLWPLAMCVATLLIAINGGRIGSTIWIDARFDPTKMPVAAVDYVAARRMSHPILTPDSWGGYLIYRRFPQERVVADDRHDLYGEDFFKSYLKMVHVEAGWQEFLRDHDVSCVLFPRNAALTNVLLESPGWAVLYRDDVAVLMARQTPQASGERGCN